MAEPVIIKKYPNRRLYNTETSDYINLEDLYQMVKQNIDFVVQDAKTGEDLTRLTLTQIIFEQENKGYNMLPISFLRQLIVFYDDNLRGVLPYYLETAMKTFAHNQENVRHYTDQMHNAFGNLSPFRLFEDMARQNMSIFEQSMKMFFNNKK